MTRFDHRERLERARIEMAARDIDVLLVSLGSDLPYLTGYAAMPLERLTMAVIPQDDQAVLVVPELEAARVEPMPEVFRIQTDDMWEFAMCIWSAMDGLAILAIHPTVAIPAGLQTHG